MKNKIFISKLNKSIKSDDYMRYILYKYYEFDFESISILRGKNNKPYIKASDIKYNVSHKKNYIVAVVSDKEVGIDLEIIDDKYRKNIVDRYFFDDEKKYINYFDEEDKKNIRFFEIWTKKEAFIKKNALNLSFIKKINVMNENILTFMFQNLVISVSL